jgi:hypothetical protein
MTTESIRVDSSVLQKALAQKPNYLNKTAFLSQLIEKAINGIDSSATISGPPGRFLYSSSNSFEGLRKESEENIKETFLTPISEQFVCHDPEKHKAFLDEQKKALKKDSPAFQVFWETYNTAPRKVGQSKAKARTAWKEALKTESADNLIEAAKRAVKEQVGKMSRDEFAAPLPDAHRWLSAERFSVLLESHTPTQAEQVIPGVTVL